MCWAFIWNYKVKWKSYFLRHRNVEWNVLWLAQKWFIHKSLTHRSFLIQSVESNYWRLSNEFPLNWEFPISKVIRNKLFLGMCWKSTEGDRAFGNCWKTVYNSPPSCNFQIPEYRGNGWLFRRSIHSPWNKNQNFPKMFKIRCMVLSDQEEMDSFCDLTKKILRRYSFQFESIFNIRSLIIRWGIFIKWNKRDKQIAWRAKFKTSKFTYVAKKHNT